MSTRLVHLVIDAAEPARLARFWATALGWEVAAEESGEVERLLELLPSTEGGEFCVLSSRGSRR